MSLEYVQSIADEVGINIWLLVVILVWSFAWKLVGLWKSARKNQPIWFVAIAIINTIGILEILYIYVFSEMKKSKSSTTKSKNKKR